MAKRAAAGVIFAIFLALNAEASMISVYVIETGLPQEGVRMRHSELWENALLDVFFEAGYIVSNYPMLRLSSEPDGDILASAGFDILEAKEAGIDHILVVQADYDSVSLLSGGVSLYIFRITPYQKVFEKRVNGKTYISEREEVDNLRTIARELVSFFTN